MSLMLYISSTIQIQSQNNSNISKISELMKQRSHRSDICEIREMRDHRYEGSDKPSERLRERHNGR